VEQILLVNPRKGRVPPGLARYWATHRRRSNPKPKKRKKKRSSARGARHAAEGYTVGSLKKHRIRRRKLNPRRRHHARRRNPIYRRRRHRNPISLGSIKQQAKGALGLVAPAATGAVGALVLDLAWGYGSPYLPDAVNTNKWYALGAKVGAALLLGWAAGRFLPVPKLAARAATVGAVTTLLYGAAREQLKAQFPTVKGFGGYADYVDYSLMQDRRLGAYMPGNTPGMGAYMPGGSAPRLGFYNPAPLLDIGNSSGMAAYMPDGVAAMHGYGPDDGM
jgi:hypothetical protein